LIQEASKSATAEASEHEAKVINTFQGYRRMASSQTLWARH
jgi:hypothetical protein